MIRYIVAGVVIVLVSAITAPAHAGLERCTGCHNGRLAPDLKDRFTTTADLIRAAKSTKSPMMGSVRGNEEYLREAAKDLGLK